MIRELRLQDTKYIQQLNEESLGYTFSLEETTKKIIRILDDSFHHTVIVYEDSETKEVIGYIHAEIYETLYFPTMLNILALAVNQKKQRNGVGSKLMLALEEEARKQSILTIRLNSGATRVEAHSFYYSLGYDSEKLQKRLMKSL